MLAVMERETHMPVGDEAAASVPTIVSRKAHQFVEMLISEGQIESQEAFASAAYQSHYEGMRNKMFGKRPDGGAKKPIPTKKATK